MYVSTTPFVAGEIAEFALGEGVTASYSTGFNLSGTCQNEVLQRAAWPDGTTHVYVIMRGMSRAKAEAIVMILNAPEVPSS